MAINKKVNDRFHYNKAEKINKNFMYKDLRRANCYNCNFTGSNFNFTSFRGAHFKACDFYDCKFDSAEFIGSNLKNSKFRKAKIENAIFEGVNLDGADFTGARFNNVIFVDTDISKASNLKLSEGTYKIFDSMPELEISESLEEALKKAMSNEYIKKSRVLDNKEGNINTISVMRLLDRFNEKTLILGLKRISDSIDREFCTLSYIVKAIEKCQKEGML